MEELFHLYYESSGLATDTRKIEQGTLFVALKGDNFDGNDYVHEAMHLGAKYVLTSRKELEDGEKVFFTEDTLLFIQRLANWHRRKFNIPVLAITGSNGKTTTKELVHAVLSKKFNTLATIGNLNNHLGVPFTLLRLNETHEVAIIEMGASKKGDIKELVDIAEPTHGVITGIGAAHIEGFGSLEGVIETKSELYDFLLQKEGHVFINGDDAILKKQLGSFANRTSYGLSASNDYNGKIESMNPFLSFSWSKEKSLDFSTVQTKMVGAYNLNNFLCAVAVGAYFGVPKEEINRALELYLPSNNRSQIVKTERNTVVMDAYNANVSSMKAALDSFTEMTGENKTVILGDMRELGYISLEEHQKLVDYLDSKFPHWQVFLVGEEFGRTSRNGEFKYFADVLECRNYLIHEKIQDQLILLKGSRGIALEKLLEVL